jgi:hypothetical protein
MEPEIKQEENIINEDEQLDKELESSINSLKAGEKIGESNQKNPNEVIPVKKEEPQGDAEDPAKPQEEEKKEEEYDFRIPNKGKFESDESYEKRIELMDLVKRRKAAQTPEQKKELTDQIKTAKSQIKNLNSSDKINQETKAPNNLEEDETLKADRERLRQLGGVTKEEVEDVIKQERQTSEVKNTLDKFIDRHTELKDEDMREVFFDFVDQNFNWQGKSGKDLMTVLEIARESMFKPSETVQERVIKAANVAEKVNAMQFPGGTMNNKSDSPEKTQSIKELVSTGMSEEKARELLSED